MSINYDIKFYTLYSCKTRISVLITVVITYYGVILERKKINLISITRQNVVD